MGTASGNSKPGVAAAVAIEAMEPIATRVVVKCILKTFVRLNERQRYCTIGGRRCLSLEEPAAELGYLQPTERGSFLIV